MATDIKACHLHGTKRLVARHRDSTKRENMAFPVSCSDGLQKTIGKFISAALMVRQGALSHRFKSISLDNVFSETHLADRLPPTDPREIFLTMAVHCLWRTRLTRALIWD